MKFRKYLASTLLLLLLISLIVFTPQPGITASNASILITEVFYDTNVTNEPDEYVAIYNPTAAAVDISNWQISNTANHRGFPSGTSIAPAQTIYVTKTATTFKQQQGFQANFEYGSDSDTTVPNMVNVTTTAPAFANGGDEVILKNGAGATVDAVVYGTGDTTTAGWSGAAVPVVSAGDVMFRAREEATINGTSAGELNTDSNTAADWKWGTEWRTLRTFASAQAFQPYPTFTYTGNLTAYSMPDSAYSVLSALVDNATTSIDLNLYQFHLIQIMDKLIAARTAPRNVAIRVFLEGGPVGGLDDQSKYVAQKLYNAGVQVRFIVHESAENRFQRYVYDHAKYAIVDGNKTFLQSENWKKTGLPVDNSAGNRGWGAVVENVDYANYMLSVFNKDFDPNMMDSFPYTPGHAKYGEPAAGFVADSAVPTGSYVSPFASKTFTGTHTITPIITPDHGLYATKGIMGLLKSATKTLYVEQLYINKYWGPGTCNETDCPDLFLREVIAAGRRGVKVRVLLDGTFIDLTNPKDNTYTRDLINSIAATEGLDMEARIVDTTVTKYEKIHNKGIIVDGRYTLVSSINWSENSPANNREVGLNIDNPDIADFYTDIFYYDWYNGNAVKWVTIAEVMYDPIGVESDEEWIELHNPTAAAIDIGGWTLNDNGGSWTIPTGTSIAAGQFFTIARNGAAFQARHGVAANLSGLTLSLSNTGDFVKLVNTTGFEFDRVAWSNYLHNWSISAAEGTTVARTTGGKDTNSRLDWTASATPSPNTGTAGGGGGGVPPGSINHLVVSEVSYDTPGDDTKEEWIEIYNGTGTGVDLSGWTLSDNAGTWTFPTETVITNGQFLVVARDAAGFKALYGKDPNIGGLTLSLSNSGDVVRLKNAAGTEIDMVAYEGFVAGWTIAAATGQSIHRSPVTTDTDAVADWVVLATPTPNAGP